MGTPVTHPVVAGFTATIAESALLTLISGCTALAWASFVWRHWDDFPLPLFTDAVLVFSVATTRHNYSLDRDRRTLPIQWRVIGCEMHKLTTYQRSQCIL